MKYFLLALFVAAVTAAPAPIPDDNQAVEVIVNGVPEGQALELGDIVDIKLKEHVDGQVAASTDLLHPYTAVGLAEAAAVAAAAEGSSVNFVEYADNVVVSPALIDVPSPVAVIPVPGEQAPPQDIIAIMPIPGVVPDVPSPVAVIPMPETPVAPPPQDIIAVMPIPGETPVAPPPQDIIAVMPIPGETPVAPPPQDIIAIVPVPQEPAPVPAAQAPNEIFNDGLVQVKVNGEAGVFSTLQSWFSLIVNYFNNDAQVSHQIV